MEDFVSGGTMSDIYLVSDYGKLYKNNYTFNFLYPDGTISKFFPHSIERIFIIGNIEITPEALKMLMHNKIEVIFLSKNGLFNAKLIFADSKNVLLRKKQYDKLNNVSFILRWCKNIIEGKIRNQIVFANRIKRKHKEATQLQEMLNSMKEILLKLDNATNANELRGYKSAVFIF